MGLSDEARAIGEQAAFPGVILTNPGEWTSAATGMTYRQWLVGMAMQAMLNRTIEPYLGFKLNAQVAIQQADAQLVALAEEKRDGES